MCLPLSPTDYRERSSNDDVQGQRYEYVQPQAKQRLLFQPSEHFFAVIGTKRLQTSRSRLGKALPT